MNAERLPKPLTLLLAALALGAVSSANAQNPAVPESSGNEGYILTLRLQPAPGAEIIAEVPRSDDRLTIGDRVLDEESARQGWFWAEFRGRFTGYVALEDVGKGLRVLPGAVIRQEPDPSASVLTVVGENDSVEVLWAEEWAQVEFEKAVPVYFQDTRAPLPLADSGTSPAAIEDAAPSAVGSAESGGPAAETPGRDDETGQNEGPIHRYFEGVLQRASGGILSFGRAPYEYELVDSQGNRIAYLETSRLLTTRPLINFEEQDVILFGTPRRDDKGRLVVEVRNLRER